MQDPPQLDDVLRSAARLQTVVPDAVLVGGAAAALWANHRDSFDHDHVLTDLVDRYQEILEAVEATDGWVTSVRASRPPWTLLGRLGDIEAGLRQLRRRRPLEVEEVEVGPGQTVRVPTLPEMLRVKSYMVVLRNVVRDYLDVVAVAARQEDTAVETLLGIDRYYVDRSDEADSVLTALIQRLSDPNPRDQAVTAELPRYRNLDPRWHDWSTVVSECQRLADSVVELSEPQDSDI